MIRREDGIIKLGNKQKHFIFEVNKSCHYIVQVLDLLSLGNLASNSGNFVVFLKAACINSIRHYHKIELDDSRALLYWSVP